MRGKGWNNVGAANNLLKHFGSSNQVRLAQLSEIEKIKGINKNVAKKIYNFFHEN